MKKSLRCFLEFALFEYSRSTATQSLTILWFFYKNPLRLTYDWRSFLNLTWTRFVWLCFIFYIFSIWLPRLRMSTSKNQQNFTGFEVWITLLNYIAAYYLVFTRFWHFTLFQCSILLVLVIYLRSHTCGPYTLPLTPPLSWYWQSKKRIYQFWQAFVMIILHQMTRCLWDNKKHIDDALLAHIIFR